MYDANSSRGSETSSSDCVQLCILLRQNADVPCYAIVHLFAYLTQSAVSVGFDSNVSL